MNKSLFKTYYTLTKPGIIYGNLLTAAAGFFLAAKGTIDITLFLSMLFGTGLIIGSGCVFNNYIDRDIDQKMSRTKNRALVIKAISEKHALIFGTILGILGVVFLVLFTNILTTIVGIIGFIFYVFIYGYAKRASDFGTLIGSIPGATPPLAGYLSVTNHIDAAAVILFFILVCWQMPHFYAIAIYRKEDYKLAGIPVLSLTQGIRVTKIHMIFYAVLYLASLFSLVFYRYVGYSFLFVMGFLGTYWLWLCVTGLQVTEDIAWARKVFGVSLILILVFACMLALNVALP